MNDIEIAKNCDELYIPLSSSLYEPGKIVECDKVVVELGTGYFCEKSVPEAKELVDRKMTLINKSIETIEGVGLQKKNNLSQLAQIIQYKMCLTK